MSHEQGNHDGLTEVTFDVSKPSGQVEFLGLLDGLAGFGNKLSGLFGWTCHACGTVNRDTAAIEPLQSSLVQWSCKQCSQALVVRFLARSGGDWIAQHSLAITGKAFCHQAEEPPEEGPCVRKKSARSGQRTFAWITVPALAAVILLGISDMRRIRSSRASTDRQRREHSATSYAWLGGYWAGEDPNDRIFFGYMNPTADTGAYTRVARDGSPPRIVRVEIVHEETTDDRLVLQELEKRAY